jgi:hypothetical protein
MHSMMARDSEHDRLEVSTIRHVRANSRPGDGKMGE